MLRYLHVALALLPFAAGGATVGVDSLSFDDRSPVIHYHPAKAWNVTTEQDGHVCATSGSSATIGFTGTGITIYGIARGRVRLFHDGSEVTQGSTTNISLNDSQTLEAGPDDQVVSLAPLENTYHNVSLVLESGALNLTGIETWVDGGNGSESKTPEMYALDDRREVTDFYKNVTGQWSKLEAVSSVMTTVPGSSIRLTIPPKTYYAYFAAPLTGSPGDFGPYNVSVDPSPLVGPSSMSFDGVYGGRNGPMQQPSKYRNIPHRNGDIYPFEVRQHTMLLYYATLVPEVNYTITFTFNGTPQQYFAIQVSSFFIYWKKFEFLEHKWVVRLIIIFTVIPGVMILTCCGICILRKGRKAKLADNA